MTELRHFWIRSSQRRHLPCDVSQLRTSHSYRDTATNGSLRLDQCGRLYVALVQLAAPQRQDLSNRQFRRHLMLVAFCLLMEGSAERTPVVAPDVLGGVGASSSLVHPWGRTELVVQERVERGGRCCESLVGDRGVLARF